METVYLQTLVEIVGTGSFSKAADKLCISQSAVSRRVKFMEDQYGHALVDRSGPVMVATTAGELVIERSRKILELEQGLLASLLALSAKRSLRFACTNTFGFCHLPRVLSAYLTRRPDVQDLSFHCDTPERVIEGLQTGAIDIAVVEHCPSFKLPDLPMFPLQPDEIVFVSSALGRLPAELDDLDDLLDRTLFARAEGCCSRRLLEMNLRSHGRALTDFRKVVVIDDLRLITAAVAAGDGIAFASTELVASELAGGTIRAHRVAGFRHCRSRTLLMANGARTREIAELAGILKSSFRPNNELVAHT